jgi:hypothetical protein
MDIPGTEQIAEIMQATVKDRQVMTISAATRQGIDELKVKLVECLAAA